MPEIVHIVMWRLSGTTAAVKDQQAAAIIQAFERARNDIPGLLRLEVGRNLGTECDTWDVALYMAFESRRHLEAYQAHPSHVAIKALVGPLRTSRCQVDFEVHAKR